MNVFFDTSVLVAASVGQHPHHPQAYTTVTRILKVKHKAYIAMHSLAEIYSALTRLPVQPAIHPGEAARNELGGLDKREDHFRRCLQQGTGAGVLIPA